MSFTMTNPASISRPINGEGGESQKARLARRGAQQAFQQLSEQFGERLLDIIPNMWRSMAGGLLSACQSSKEIQLHVSNPSPHRPTDPPEKTDALIEKQYGQDVIDSLTVLEAVVPTFHHGLQPRLRELFPMMEMALRSRFAIVRQVAARCFATICDAVTPEAMRYIIENVMPFLQDPLVVTNRQGSMELIYREQYLTPYLGNNALT